MWPATGDAHAAGSLPQAGTNTCALSLSLSVCVQCYSGTEAPCAYGELISIGAIGGEKNKQVCQSSAGWGVAEAGCTTSLARAVGGHFVPLLNEAEWTSHRSHMWILMDPDPPVAARNSTTVAVLCSLQISGAIADVLKSKLKIDPSRLYLKVSASAPPQPLVA